MKVPRLRPFVLMLREACRWSTGGMELTGETRSIGEKPVPVPLGPPQISHGLTGIKHNPGKNRGRGSEQ
jgi:hypothetical protein